eukprot:GEMP01014474.1.p1 GENE.GEMP01014474.1~~GEMP01014474.1.p1  ORF type:complete len:601 (+),score=123.22 GEMP01014474.1:32-1804(+)
MSVGYEEKPPIVHAGAFLDQHKAVRESEDLQDFRREREGHLLIRDDRPMLIMSFGTKYTGQHGSKYRIEGKYHIPCGFKSIVKWDEDEIVFMTRQGEFSPEFQIIYLPKSSIAEDFTVFEWNGNIAEIWDQLLTVLESQDKDMTMFEKGPWYTFGVVDDTVQIAIVKAMDEKNVVEGILYCVDGQTPTMGEYERYIGLNLDSDEAYRWISHEFQNDALPPNVFQYISNGMVYWVNTATEDRTWKHPHYEKYKSMLTQARRLRPLPHWKSIMAFQIECLFQSLYSWECEATGVYPLEETVENVKELSRIFKIDVKSEPYLVHVVLRALRHYGCVVREKRCVGEVQDFRSLMQRYRDLVTQCERARVMEQQQVRSLMLCVECPPGSQTDAVLYCDHCRDLFCQACFDRLHGRGRRKKHKRTWVELGVCGECEETLAIFSCVQCQDAYCRDCYQDWHARGGRRNHIPIILRSFTTATHKIPSQSVFEFGKIAAAAITVGSQAGVNLAKALSPWIMLKDKIGVRLYWNVSSDEIRRDMPLAVINEPIEDQLGGGLAGLWAGSWGADMFEERAHSRSDTTSRTETTSTTQLSRQG